MNNQLGLIRIKRELIKYENYVPILFGQHGLMKDFGVHDLE
jgi:hypothetical protein